VKWGTLIELEHPTTTCWQAGAFSFHLEKYSANLFFYLFSPTLVANLWDVTDKDIDRLSQSVFDKLHLTGKEITQLTEKRSRVPVSLIAAVAQSRDSCKLKYLTGAAPVVYGIPFYL
jgi:hypothetical protein